MFAPLQALFQGLPEGLGEAVLELFLAGIHQTYRGQLGVGYGPIPQGEQGVRMFVAFPNGVGPGFQGRGGGPQHNGHIALPSPEYGHVPGGIAHPILLFEGGVVLLIHHNQAQIRQGGENRQSGAQHNAGAAVEGRLPMPGAGRFPQFAMEGHQAHFGKTPPKAGFQLGGEINFRHQHQGLPPFRQGPGHQAQINLGLARTGDAVEEKRMEAGTGAQHGFHRLGLARGKVRRQGPGGDLGTGPHGPGLGGMGAAQAHGQGSQHGFPQGHVVIGSAKAAETQPIRGQGRQIPENFIHRLQLVRR